MHSGTNKIFISYFNAKIQSFYMHEQ